jgi:hypothetical protein
MNTGRKSTDEGNAAAGFADSSECAKAAGQKHNTAIKQAPPHVRQSWICQAFMTGKKNPS